MKNTEKIRVLELISGFAVEGPLGGIERFGIELVQAFDKNDIEPIICGLWAYGTLTESYWVEKLTAKHIQAFIATDWEEKSPYSSFVRAYKETIAKVKSPVDIIHSHCQFGDVLALLLKKKLGAKILVRTVHNEREWGKRPFRRIFLTGGLYPVKFDTELGVSQQVVNNLNRRFMVRMTKKRAIKAYNALNLQRFESININIETKKRQLGIPLDTYVVGTVGRLTEQKGITYLIDAIPIVLKHEPKTTFIIIGYGELEHDLKNQAHILDISDQTIFTGARSDVEELYPIMDLFVNSSLWEGLPTVIMESMMAEVPVVATQVSGNKELIQDRVTGRLIEPANPSVLACAIVEMLQMQKEEKDKICIQAKRFVTENFSINTVAQQYHNLYENLLT